MRDRPEIEPLSAMVALLRPRTVLSKVISGAGSWSVRYAAYGHPGFSLILEGSCWLSVADQEPLWLEPGDFVMLPATPSFSMASNLEALRNPVATSADAGRTTELRHGDQNAAPSVRMLGGYFLFDPTNARLLLSLLPAVVHIKATDSGADRLAWITRAVGDEATSMRPGRDPILVRLAEIMLIEALRWRPAKASQMTGLLAGLADTQIANALRAFHEDVSRKWTVESFAHVAGMSRASFAEKFSRTLGVAPMDYVTRWRMALAKDLLRHDDTSLTQVATIIGYQSASAFSTAFSRYVGQAPSGFARQKVEFGH